MRLCPIIQFQPQAIRLTTAISLPSRGTQIPIINRKRFTHRFSLTSGLVSGTTDGLLLRAGASAMSGRFRQYRRPCWLAAPFQTLTPTGSIIKQRRGTLAYGRLLNLV